MIFYFSNFTMSIAGLGLQPTNSRLNDKLLHHNYVMIGYRVKASISNFLDMARL